MADGPVLFGRVEHVHEYILRPNAGILAEQLHQPPVLGESARKAFADLMTRITDLVQDALAAGVKRGEFHGAPELAASHIVTVTRGLAVLERAYDDEPKLRRIAAHTIDLVLGKVSGHAGR